MTDVTKLPVLLFMGQHYYPEGGWSDFAGFFDTVEDAEAHLAENPPSPDRRAHDWADIVENGKMVSHWAVGGDGAWKRIEKRMAGGWL